MSQKTKIEMNAVDRFISYIAPGAALKRMSARHVLSQYDAAKPSRLRRSGTDSRSPDQQVQQGATALRALARNLEQNHDIARGALRVLVIDSIAASIASLIAMAGDRVEMAENAAVMLHAPWGGIAGNSVALREYADMLDTWAEAMATSYAAKTGGDKAEILSLLMDGKDRWYTAEQALEANLVDAVISALPVAASANLHSLIKARFASFPQPTTPAAAAAPTPTTTPKESITMSGSNPAAAAVPVAAAPAAQTHEQIVAAALAADGVRRTAISSAFAKFAQAPGVAAVEAACAADTACTVEAAQLRLLAHLGSGSAPIAGSHIVTLEDSRDKFRAGIQASLMARANLGKDDGANNYRGYSAMDIARECLVQAGISTRGLGKMELVSAAFTHTGSDFPLLLANVAEKAMMKGYEEAEETFQLWTAIGSLGDFKPGKRVDLNTFTWP